MPTTTLPSETEIRTERLLLRRPLEDDLEAMFAITSNAAAMRYWSTVPHAELEVTRGWLANIIAGNAAGGEDFFIEHDGAVIGLVGAGRIPDFGFILHPEYWGRGFATEASIAAVGHIFSTGKTDALCADVDPRNAASLAVLKRLGFIETGTAKNTFKLGDEWCDSVYLRLDRFKV